MHTKKAKQWIVTADTNACVIYSHIQYSHALTFVQRLSHPENKLRDIELTSDKPGHYQTGGTARGAYEQETDPKEHLIDLLALEIANVLDHARTQHQYEQWVLIALPHMNGLIKKHLNKHVAECLQQSIEKNTMHMSAEELFEVLSAQTRAQLKM